MTLAALWYWRENVAALEAFTFAFTDDGFGCITSAFGAFGKDDFA